MKSLARGHLKAGVDSVRGAKFRSFWTMLGIIIGVTSVITAVSIGEGIKQQIGGQIHHTGSDLITVRPAPLHTGSDSSNSALDLISGLNVSAPLTAKDVDTVQQVAGVSGSAPLTIVSGTASGVNGNYNDGFVLGTSSALADLVNQPLAYGAFLGDENVGTNVAVLGQHAVDKLFDEDVPLGRSFSFHGQRFIVKGIFKQFPSAPLSQQADFNNAIFIPNDVAERLSQNSAPTYEMLVQPNKTEKTAQIATSIEQALAKTHGGQSHFAVLTGNQNLNNSDTILSLLTRLIAGVAAISLLVGGIGIMNVMLVSVAERMHEIGIRKAVGATNRQILSQFMIESSVISFAGGVIGIILAFVIEGVLRVFTSLQPIISWQIVLLASGVSLLVGVIFGTVPAFQAARKDPIEALRSQ